MADNLTDVAESLAMDWLCAVGSPVRPATLVVRLMTANGSDSAAGTEVANSGGSTYAAQSVTFSAASSGATSNTGLLQFTGMPSCTVTGLEIWDTSGTPRRLWYGALAASKVVNSGDVFEIAIGDLDLSIG